MSNTYYETLKRRYPDKFIDNCNKDIPTFVICQGGETTIDDSNVEAIFQELGGTFPHGVDRVTLPYAEVFAYVDDLESNEELARHVLEVLEALESHPIYDEFHYHDLEIERRVKYMRSTLVTELARELDRDDVEEIEQHVRANEPLILECTAGSIDDESPFDVKAIVKRVF